MLEKHLLCLPIYSDDAFHHEKFYRVDSGALFLIMKNNAPEKMYKDFSPIVKVNINYSDFGVKHPLLK